MAMVGQTAWIRLASKVCSRTSWMRCRGSARSWYAGGQAIHASGHRSAHSCARSPSAAGSPVWRSAGRDPGDEDVGGPVASLRRCQGEDGGEPAAAQGGQPLVLAHVVPDRKVCGPQVGGAGEVGLPPGGAVVAGVGETYIGGQC